MPGERGRYKASAFVGALALALCLCGLLCAGAGFASTGKAKLTIPRATERADNFAESTCRQDESCVRSGVLSCAGKGDLVANCRIFDERHTDAQGNYRCNREIRIVMDRKTLRAPVNGLGRWQCGGGRAAPE